jgi:hypothetical protein
MMTRFNWNLEGLTEVEFIAVRCLLKYRSTQQESSKEEDLVEIENETLADSEDPRAISTARNSELKRRCCDRLAELLSHKSGADYVSCAVLQEQEDCAIFFVARNTGFEESDMVFLNEIGEVLTSISRNGTLIA